MKVYVVMRNDFPECVFEDESDATALVDAREAEMRRAGRSCNGALWDYWRHYEMEVVAKATASAEDHAS